MLKAINICHPVAGLHENSEHVCVALDLRRQVLHIDLIMTITALIFQRCRDSVRVKLRCICAVLHLGKHSIVVHCLVRSRLLGGQITTIVRHAVQNAERISLTAHAHL